MEMTFVNLDKKYHEQCIDPLTHIQGYTSKDVYNKTLDKRIIKLYNLNDDIIRQNNYAL